MKTEIKTWFQTHYPHWVEKMKQTSHHHSNGSLNPFHLEGDVWTHTQKVLESLESDKPELILAALLHDIGKCETRYEKESGKVSFFYHESVSTFYAIEILHCFSRIQPINILKTLYLINWHGAIWKTGEEELSARLKTFDHLFGHDNDLYQDMICFVKADAFGREMEDELMELELLEQFEVFENYLPFDHFSHAKADQKSTVTLLIGLSGAGKSTWVEKHRKSQTLISIDNYLTKGKLNYNSVDYKKNAKKAHDQSLKEIKEAVAKEKSVIIDMTNLSKETRRKKLQHFPSTKYKKRAVVFLPSESMIKENLKKRPDKTIPMEVITKQIRNLELPGYDEFDEIEFVY